MSKKVTVLLVPVDDHPRVVEVDGDLASYQALVGGYIEKVTLENDGPRYTIDLICNEEGKLIGLPINRVVRLWNGWPVLPDPRR